MAEDRESSTTGPTVYAGESAECASAGDRTSDEVAGSWSGVPLSSAPDELIGATLHETYVVERVLGEGGMGRVYEAHHTRVPNKRFAIKVLHPEYVLNASLVARFQREAEAAASVEHPGVVGIYDVGHTPQGWPYMVCEHLSGIDLHSYIKRFAPLPSETVVYFGRALCEALGAAHAQGVIHRDLKPHNVFLVGDFTSGVPARPRLKVLDFGLSRFLDQDSQLTQTGVVMGTPGYMSPEQACGRSTDHRTDVYGVGAILYTAATGRPPFTAKTPRMTVMAVLSEDPPRPRSIQPTVSAELEVVIQRAMAREPDERYQDMVQLGTALSTVVLGSPQTVVPPAHKASELPLSAGEARAARVRFVALALAAFGLMALGGGTAVAGALQLDPTRTGFTTTELVLLGALALACAFPAALLWRRFRLRVWPNSAIVVSWLPRWRAPLIAALFAYGLGALLVRFADSVMAHISRFGVASGSGWPGWNLILPSIGLVAAGGAVLHQLRWRRRGRLQRWLLGPVLTVVVTLVCAVLLAAGFSRRGPSGRAVAITPDRARTAARVDRAPAPRELPSSRSAHHSEPHRPPEAQRAPDDELAAAVAQGPDSLRSLAQAYPDDSEPLRALVLAYASRASTLADAVETVKGLLTVAPEQGRDPEIRYIVSKAAQSGGRAADLAFAVMHQYMGSAGADLLYDLALRKPALESRASGLLAELRRKKKLSAALSIAYDLRFAPSCSARLRLLPRAAELGDERSVALLAALSTKPTDCRKKKRTACKVPCEQEAKQFRQTIDQIARRPRATGNGE
ncbi:MAG: serine/threonine protein kinase [Polyangiaceae bacterium]|nr:serine/threonine protein kinase [Polyangiaceae bacterium]